MSESKTQCPLCHNFENHQAGCRIGTLELELNEALKQTNNQSERINELVKICEEWRTDYTKQYAQLAAAQAELNEAKKELDRKEHGSNGWQWRKAIMGLLVKLGIEKLNWGESFTYGWGGPFEFIKGTFTERDELRSQLTTAQQEIAELKQLLELAKSATSGNEKDKERLDWLERSHTFDGGMLWAKVGGLKGVQCSTLRQAIDSAMKGTK